MAEPYLASLGSGSTFAAFGRTELESLEIPLPSLAEQNRIAGKLSEALDLVARARAAAEERLEAARALKRSLLGRVFTSPQSERWPMHAIGDVCDIQLGKMLSPKSKTGTMAATYLRNANVQWDRFDLSDMATMDFDDRERAKFLLKEGDLLVCEGGEPGRSAVWNAEIGPCFYQKALLRLRPRPGAADPHFLMFRLWHGSFEGEFEASHARTTIAHLPAVRLSALKVRLPSIEVQRRIVEQSRVAFAELERATGAAEEVQSFVEALPAALLRRAFRGEL